MNVRLRISGSIIEALSTPISSATRRVHLSRDLPRDASDLHKSKLLLTASGNCRINGNFSQNRLRLAFRLLEAVTTLMDERLRHRFSFPEARKVANCCESIEFRRFPSFASLPLVNRQSLVVELVKCQNSGD